MEAISPTVWYRIDGAMAGKSKPGKIRLHIIEVMKRFPGGISGGQIRQELEKEGLEPGDQTHLDRRKRDLKKWFVISKDLSNIVVAGKNRRIALYRYVGVRRKVVDEGQVSLRERAEVIHGAHGRCQMCGKSVEQHGALLRRVSESRGDTYALVRLGPVAIGAVARSASNLSRSVLISVSAKA
jgi:hypothetical protein